MNRSPSVANWSTSDRSSDRSRANETEIPPVKPTVLIVTTTNWVPTARLAVALASAGFRVEALCPAEHPVGETQAAYRRHTYCGLTPLRSLAHAIAVSKPDLVVPGDDLAARHLHDLYFRRESYSRDAGRIGALIERSLGSAESFSIAQSRAAFMDRAREEGIRVPSTGVIETASDIRTCVEKVGLPAVLKADGTSGGEGVRMVRTFEEAQRAFRKLHAPPLVARAIKRALVDRDTTLLSRSLCRQHPVISVQSFVVGREATSTIVCWKGAVLASLHFEVLRKCTAAGHATVVRLIENAEMSNAVEKVVRRMGLSGMCGFDFMLEGGTGHAYLIEMNPRATQVGHITLGAGRDLPGALYSAVSGHPSRVAPSVTESDTIALFPHEWARDPESEFLRTGYHDVPWDAPKLVHRGVLRGQKQSAWYSRGNANREVVEVPFERASSDQLRREELYEVRKPVQVMKFGGTSVGDAACIGRVVEIIRGASRECSVAVVVSAMGGVTNRLIEAAIESKAGDERGVAEIFAELKERHDDTARSLIHSEDRRYRLQKKLSELFLEGESLCKDTISHGELTPRTLDAISGLGERLCAPLVAAALAEIGVASEAIEATELVITDSYHGGAEPWLDATRARCRVRVAPLLEKGVVPVVTGFIGANEEGVLTTLGRGGSDYSATILGAALDADEVVIWSDVPGLLTADPRLVEDARTISEISYSEAAELAHFGAKVLHPKTLRPVTQSGIPIWIKNTFAPYGPATKITPTGSPQAGGVRALTAIRDAALITIARPTDQGGAQDASDLLARSLAAAAAARANVLLSQSSSHSHNSSHNHSQSVISLVVLAALAERTVDALKREFTANTSHEKTEYTVLESAVSVITIVGQNLLADSGMAERALAALGQDLKIAANVQGSSDCSMSFVVPQQYVKLALTNLHRELALGSHPSNGHQVIHVAGPSPIWNCATEPAAAD
jgi:aspartokinase/homoserine dehydrogenase 1